MAEPQTDYFVYLLKAWTNDRLAYKMEATLHHIPKDAIISIETRIDFQFFVPWRRNSAMIIVRRSEREIAAARTAAASSAT